MAAKQRGGPPDGLDPPGGVAVASGQAPRARLAAEPLVAPLPEDHRLVPARQQVQRPTPLVQRAAADAAPAAVADRRAAALKFAEPQQLSLGGRGHLLEPRRHVRGRHLLRDRKGRRAHPVQHVGQLPVVAPAQRAFGQHRRGVDRGHRAVGGDGPGRAARTQGLVAEAAVPARPPRLVAREVDHVAEGPADPLRRADVGPRGVAALPRRVQPRQVAVAPAKPPPERRQRVLAVARQAVGVNVPARLVPAVPAVDVARAAVAAANVGQEAAHPIGDLGMVEAAAGGEPHVDLRPRAGDGRPPGVVHQLRPGHHPVDPERLDLRDRAEHDLQAEPIGRRHELVVVPVVVRAGLVLDPSPDAPELDAV